MSLTCHSIFLLRWRRSEKHEGQNRPLKTSIKREHALETGEQVKREANEYDKIEKSIYPGAFAGS